MTDAPIVCNCRWCGKPSPARLCPKCAPEIEEAKRDMAMVHEMSAAIATWKLRVTSWEDWWIRYYLVPRIMQLGRPVEPDGPRVLVLQQAQRTKVRRLYASLKNKA